MSHRGAVREVRRRLGRGMGQRVPVAGADGQTVVAYFASASGQKKRPQLLPPAPGPFLPPGAMGGLAASPNSGPRHLFPAYRVAEVELEWLNSASNPDQGSLGIG